MSKRTSTFLIFASALLILLSGCGGGESFPLANPQFVPTTMNLPVINITTSYAEPIQSKVIYVAGSISITPTAGSTDVAYSGTMQIRGHGTSTWLLPKKPYKVKLDTKASLL